jgi:alpha-glucosidase
MSISGMGFTGSDIGGFAEQPSGDLYARWIQRCFHPSVGHSSGDHGDQEPWAFDEDIIDITRKFVNLRYQLLPYLYHVLAEEGKNAHDQSDIQTHYRNDNLFFGNQILVCPILEPNAIGRRMYVRGQWYNYWTNDFVNGGRKFGLILNLTKSSVYKKACHYSEISCSTICRRIRI